MDVVETNGGPAGVLCKSRRNGALPFRKDREDRDREVLFFILHEKKERKQASKQANLVCFSLDRLI
jgi:hypothetical protein